MDYGHTIGHRLGCPSTLAILWTGWATVAYTIYAQTLWATSGSTRHGQSILHLSTSVSGHFAWVVLQETLGPAGWLLVAHSLVKQFCSWQYNL